jgi:hypothetical protein
MDECADRQHDGRHDIKQEPTGVEQGPEPVHPPTRTTHAPEG